MFLRRGGVWVLAILSASLFAWGLHDPWALSVPIHQNFPVLLWQPLFVAGIVLGRSLKRYDGWSSAAKGKLLAAVAGVWGVLFYLEHAADFGLTPPTVPLVFHKVPLSGGELLRYFTLMGTIMLGTDLLWSRLAQRRWVEAVCQLGRKSLPVYVAHVWVVAIVVTICWKLWWIGAAQVIFAIAALVTLWAFARLLERADRTLGPRLMQPGPSGLKLAPFLWPTLGMVGSMMVLLPFNAYQRASVAQDGAMLMDQALIDASDFDRPELPDDLFPQPSDDDYDDASPA
jgi:hypothetical protein